VIGKLLVAEGTANVKVNTPIAVLVEDGESVSASPAASSSAVGGSSVAPAPVAAAPVAAVAAAPVAAPVAVVSKASPDWAPGTPMKTMTVREALREAMAEEMRANPNVFLMGEEVGEYQGAYKISQGLLDEFGPKRVIDTPITEIGFTGIAVGAAWGGLNPIVEFMTFNFAMQAIDHIINSAAKTNYMSGGQVPCPIVFRGANGAAARVMPYSASDAKGLLKMAIRDPNPVVFLENEILYGQSFEVPDLPDFTIPFGKARVWREGTDVTIVSFGIGMRYALEAADILAKDGISAEVIDLRTLRPIDYDTVIASVQKTNRCVTVEEGFPVGSIGDHMASTIMQRAFDYLDAPVVTCTGKDVPMPYAANLEKLALVTTAEVVAAVKSVCYR